MASLYWIEAALPGLAPALWMAAGIGLPWAFAALPRRDWRSGALVGALALILGPAWITAWMLLLGVVGAQLEMKLLTANWIIPGSALLGLAGAALAWRKRGQALSDASRKIALALDEKLIVAFIVSAVVLRWIHTAYFPFTVYDALWVYGFQGRLYFLEGVIPNDIGYYPPFLSLQFAYVQTLIGAVNDHAARMVLPLLHIGSILAAYLLGQRLVNRRVGLITAALWSLHPYVGQWSFRGDLEIPLTFSFTLAAVFFLSAWREGDDAAARRNRAILAGMMLGIALLTKPTAGAFIWGILLLFAHELLRTRLEARRWLPRFRLILWTALACLPLGAVWYLRNLALGHEAVTLPKALWLTRALRNGDYLAPLLAAVVIGWLAVALGRKLHGRDLALGVAGIALMLAGALASNSSLFPARVDPPASYISAAEALVMLAGLALIAISLRAAIAATIRGPAPHWLRVGVWSLLLALPYFLTFFFSYSYHYRLGFAIMPLLCLPIAIALARVLDAERVQRWKPGLRRAYILFIALLCLPGTIAVMTDVGWTQVWLRRAELDSDFKKYQVYNPSLMEMVVGLQDFIRDAEGEAIVLAPGEERLPFFFPQMRIIVAPATTLDEFEALQATHFVYGAKAREAYRGAGIEPERTQLVSALGRYDLFRKVKSHYDGVFSYELHQARDLAQRWQLPRHFAAYEDELPAVIFDGKLRLYVGGAYPNVIHEDTPITLEPTWQTAEALPQDYEFVLQLRNADGKLAYQWRFRMASHRHGAYQTTQWQVGEFINDRPVFRLDRQADLDAPGFTMWLGVWDASADRFLPLEVDGEATGEFHRLEGEYRLKS